MHESLRFFICFSRSFTSVLVSFGPLFGCASRSQRVLQCADSTSRFSNDVICCTDKGIRRKMPPSFVAFSLRKGGTLGWRARERLARSLDSDLSLVAASSRLITRSCLAHSRQLCFSTLASRRSTRPTRGGGLNVARVRGSLRKSTKPSHSRFELLSGLTKPRFSLTSDFHPREDSTCRSECKFFCVNGGTDVDGTRYSYSSVAVTRYQ